MQRQSNNSDVMITISDRFKDALRTRAPVIWSAATTVARSVKERMRPRHVTLAGRKIAVDNATLAQIKSTQGAPPVVNIQVARTCNLRCSFCSHTKWVNPKGFMDYALFRDILTKLKADACEQIVFCSAQGESLLHPRIFDMLTDAQNAGFKTNLVTNGTPLNADRINRIAAMELDGLQFSFCGYDKESYEAAYIGAKFEQVTRNLSMLIAALKNAASTTYFTINGVVDDKATRQFCEPDVFLARTAAYLRSLGAPDQSLRLQLPHNWGGTVAAGQPVRVNDTQIYSHRNLAMAQQKMCPLLISTPGIYVDGRVTACGCIDANGALLIGDITRQTMREIRQGQPYQALLQRFLTKDLAGVPLCETCEIPYQPEAVLNDVFYKD